MYRLDAQNVKKTFGHRVVLRDVSVSLGIGDSLAVTGPNGSGKTTLLRILAGLTFPSRGKVEFFHDDRKLGRNDVRNLVSYIGPELALYDSLTAAENLRFFAVLRGITIDRTLIGKIMDMVGLGGREDDFYHAYSSGMKQRLKYAVALLNDPVFLLLDEPTANLDKDGKIVVSGIISRQKEQGVLIVATNEKEEYGFAEKRYRLDA
jgi:heme exporter protein A